MKKTVDENGMIKRKHTFFSWPLFKQSFKANWVVWLALTAGLILILSIINIVIGSRQIFTNYDMESVTAYVSDQGLSWLKLLGMFEQMGFNLSRMQVMSQIDLNSILNDLVYKIAGTLLPIIYIILVSNKLVSAQVNDGSLAYVLATPTNRKKVIRTQYLFLILSLLAMYLASTLGSVVSELIGYKAKAIPLRTVLYNLSSFCVMVALSGVCFFASSFFTKGKYSLAIGGGFCVITFLTCILGLFGSKVFVSVGVGVESMNIFNYMSAITLFDTESISSFSKAVLNLDPDAVISYAWIWKNAILVVIGFVFAYIGSARFVRKDLPL